MREFVKEFISDFVKNTIIKFVSERKINPVPEKYPPELNSEKGVFVTLHKGQELRGCIGFCSERCIIENLRDSAIEACKDSRFPPMSASELQDLTFEVSILSAPKLIVASNPEELLKKIDAGRDGLIIESKGKSGLFLPQVWKEIPKKEDFVRHLCIKAGLPQDAWKNGAKIYKFDAEIFEGKV